QRHWDGKPAADLLENTILRAIGNFRRNHYGAIHPSATQNHPSRLAAPKPCRVELIPKHVILGRDGRFVLTFGLNTKNQDDFGTVRGLLDSNHQVDQQRGRADFLEFGRDTHGRTTERELASEFAKELDIRARPAAVLKVAKNREGQMVYGAQPVTNRQ